MIERHVQQEILELLSFFPVVGIVGPRQVGKTTLALAIAKIIEIPVQYIDLENPRDQAKLHDPVLFFENHQEKCVILDEIQRMPELFPVLRSMIDQHRVSGRFIILGSASPALIRDSSESLAGRIAYKELTPFNLLEIISQKDINVHWLKGGFPQAFMAPTQQLWSAWQQNFIRSYVERDLPFLGINAAPTVLEKLWSMLAHFHGNLLNISTLSKSLELSRATISRYIAFMEEAFLIHTLPPFSPNLKKRLVKSPKVYIRDSGIFHYLHQIESWEALVLHPVLGASWEGYVVEQIKQRLPPTHRLHFYRTHQGAEIDLVLTKASEPAISIEVKYTASPKLGKGHTVSIDDLGTKQNFVIIPCTSTYQLRKDVAVCSLDDFLGRMPEVVG